MMLNPAAENQTSASATVTADAASRMTMSVRRFIRSANTPPNGAPRIIGTNDMARMDANAVAEPVSSSTHIDMAKRSIMLPNSEMPCPATSRMKLRERSGCAAFGCACGCGCGSGEVLGCSVSCCAAGSCVSEGCAGVVGMVGSFAAGGELVSVFCVGGFGVSLMDGTAMYWGGRF